MIKRLLRWTLYTIGLVLILVIGAALFLQTAPGKRLLADQLSSHLSTPDAGFEIATIEGWIPLDMRIGSFQLSDRDGLWLKADGVTFDWSPSALLSGRVQIDDIGTERIEVIRPPRSDDIAEPPSDEPFRLPELPTSLPPIVVERLAVPEILLGPEVLGQAASLGLEGSLRANDSGDRIEATLDLQRTDEKTAFAKFEADAGLNPPILDLALHVGESGGVIADLLDRPEMGDVTLSLEGKGPLENWAGKLKADAGGLALAEADLGLALVEQPRLTLDGILQPAPGSLPDDIALLIGEEFSLDLDVIQTRAQALDLRKAAIAIHLGSADAAGSVNFDNGDLALQTHLAVPDLAPLGPLADATIVGGAKAELDLTGTLSAPKGKLDLQIDSPAFEDKSADRIVTTVDWIATAPLSSDQPAFDVVIDGQADGLALSETVLPDPDIAWNAKLAVPLEGEIGIENATLNTAGSSLTGTGAIDPTTLEGMIDLALNAPSLKRLALPYGQPIDGKALIKAAIRLADQAQTIAVDLDTDLEDLSNLPPGASELLGKQASIQAKATLDPSKTLSLETLTIDGTHIGLNGEATLKLDQQDIAGQVNVVLPDLTALGPLAPDGTKGGVDLKADLGGSLEAPLVDLRLQGRDLVLAGEPITALDITMAGHDLIAAPNGDLRIDLTARKTPATLTLDYRLADDTLNLDAIDLKAPETEIQGALAILLNETLIDGTLEGQVANLGALEPLLQQKLGGSLGLTATLTPDGISQNAGLIAQIRDVQADFGKVKTLNLDASIADATAQLLIDAKASLTGFEQGTTKIDALTLTASGNDGALDLEFGTAGEVIEKTLELSGKGAARFEDGFTLGIESLNGAFAGEPLRLESPLAFQQAGEDIWLSDLDLRLGEASITGNVEIGETAALGKINLKSLPLRWSEVFGGPPMTGDAQADIDLSGSVTNPKVVAALNIEGQLVDGVAGGDLPLDIALNALLDQGRLAADLKGSGLTQKPITATANLPARLALRPFSFDMPEDGKLDGRIDAELLLARLADLLALDDQTLKGTLFANIALGGTIGDPKVEGPVTVEGGGYENGSTGTDFRDLTLNAITSSKRVELVELAARTGKKRGTIATKGWLELDAEGHFPLSVTLNLDDARLVNRDDADARVSGEIAMTGSLNEAKVEGELTVNRAEISLPDGGGPNLPEIEVTEVGGRIVNPAEEEEEEKEKPFDPVLDLGVKLPNKIYVRGRGLDSEWQGDLQITGRASDPAVVGNLNVKRGHFDFLDKRFALERGEITFSGSTPPNPILAIEARNEDDDFTAIIKLNGPADDPKLLLSSEPVLPDDEVLARLLFNRQLSQIGPIEAGKLAIAANKLRSGGGGFDVFGEIRNVLKIDTLDVVSDEEGENLVKAGKYLDDDVYVEFEKGTGDDTGRARVEIEVLPNIAIEAETSENADTGVGVKWKLDY